MHHPILIAGLSLYFGLNFLCALGLHLHAEHQAHLRHRSMDVLVHFVLLTAFGVPALFVVVASALFGQASGGSAPLTPAVANAGVRAA